MQKNDKYQSQIKFIPFRDINLWDVKRYSFEQIKSKYPIVKLGLYIQEESKKEKLFNFPDLTFGILGVSNRIGVFDAYKEKGSEFNQAYKKMSSSWIAYNPYRINVGSIGMRTEENEHDYISPAYVVFSCKEGLLPDFLFKLFKTSRFNRVINDNTTGSVRQNLTFEVLKTLNIPLPPLEIQSKLLNRYYKKTQKSIEYDLAAKSKEGEIDDLILDSLGIKLNKTVIAKAFSTINFTHLARWSTSYLLNIDSLKGIQNSKYPIQKVRNFIKFYQYGMSVKASVEPIGIPMLRMNNINDGQLDIEDLKYISEEEEKDNMILEKGDLLFNRTNSKELVGKTAVFTLEGRYTFASYLIRLKLDENKANKEYVNYLFNSSIGRIQIDMISRQVLGQANVNAQELQELIFPMPDLNTQQKIVDQINFIKKASEKLRESADEQRRSAINELETEIFTI